MLFRNSDLPILIGNSGSGQPLIAGMGQSNIAEQGDVTLLTGGDLVYADPYNGGRYTRKIFSSETDTVAGIRDWQDYAPLSGRIGFEMGLARTLGAGYHYAKWGVGGSDLQWWTDNAKFAEAADWILSQKARLPFQTYMHSLVWCQGESGPTTGWRALAEAGFAVIRTIFQNPNLDIIIVQTHPSIGGGVVAQEQVDLAAADPHVYIVLTGSYALNPTPHWNCPEVCRIGEDVAAIAAGL